VVGRAAYRAASAAAHIVMRGSPEAFRPFDRPERRWALRRAQR
jgi:hypothetical protein